ncbi:MAG: hypothetical protein JW832_09535 [Deltaproteobacteria bacterium]|nr:hypothetical protein [Deltaproteobacteria bacterium]
MAGIFKKLKKQAKHAGKKHTIYSSVVQDAGGLPALITGQLFLKSWMARINATAYSRL